MAAFALLVATSLALNGSPRAADAAVSRRAMSALSALAVCCAAPGFARAGFLEGSPGLTSGDSAAVISKAAVSAAAGIGIKPRESGGAPPVDDLTASLLRKSEENREKNRLAVERRTYLNSEGARIFPGDGLTVFEDGVPAEISMEEYKALMESGRIVRGSRDVLPAPKQ